MIAILKTVHKKKGLEPSIHPFFSMQRLQYVDEISYKLERGLKEIKFNDIYDEWVKILRERGVYHPIWNHEDMDFVKSYRNFKRTVMCECNSQASLRVSESPSNPGRPFFGCCNKDGCRFFQWADVGFTKKNEKLQKLFKEYGRFQKKTIPLFFL